MTTSDLVRMHAARGAMHDPGPDSASPPAVAHTGPSDSELIAAWVLWQRARNLSDKTIQERINIIGRLPHPATLTPVDIDEFLVNPAWTRATRATYHGAIRAWSLWLVRTGHRSDDPTLIATTPKVPKGRPRPLADEHLVALLTSHTYRRTNAMILLAAYAGLRVGEIAGIRGEDVDLMTRTIRVNGKGNKKRDVPLHPLLGTVGKSAKARGTLIFDAPATALTLEYAAGFGRAPATWTIPA